MRGPIRQEARKKSIRRWFRERPSESESEPPSTPSGRSWENILRAFGRTGFVGLVGPPCGSTSGPRARSVDKGADDRHEPATVLLAAALRRRGGLLPLLAPAEGGALPHRPHGRGRRAPSAGPTGGLRAPRPLPGGGPPDREPPRVRLGRQDPARGVLRVRGAQDISPHFGEPHTGGVPRKFSEVHLGREWRSAAGVREKYLRGPPGVIVGSGKACRCGSMRGVL